MAEWHEDPLMRDYPSGRVPAEGHYGGWSALMIWSGTLISLPLIMAGLATGANMSLPMSATVFFGAYAVLGMMGGMVAYVGGQTHLSTFILTRITFGRLGAWLATLIIAATLFLWFGIQINLLAERLQYAISDITGHLLPLRFLRIITTLLISSTAIVGIVAVHVMSLIGVIYLIGLLSIPLILFFLDSGIEFMSLVDQHQPRTTITISGAISLLIAQKAFLAALTADIGRFTESGIKAGFSTFCAFAIVAPLVAMCAVILAAITGESSFLGALSVTGWGLAAISLLMMASWTSADTVLYIGALSIAGVLKRHRKWIVTLSCSILLTLWIAFQLNGQDPDQFLPFDWQQIAGILLSPMAATIVVAYLYDRTIYEKADHIRSRMMKPLTLTVWLSGVLIGLATLPQESGGLEIFKLSSIAVIDSYLSASLIALILFTIKHALTGSIFKADWDRQNVSLEIDNDE